MALQPLFDALATLINTPDALPVPVKAQTQAFIDSAVEDFPTALTALNSIMALPTFVECSHVAQTEFRRAAFTLGNL